jgi:hypothetical protein
METLKDLVAAARDHDGTVLAVAGRSAPYTYDDFVPNVWKAGNLLGHYGVHPGATVSVAPGPKDAGPEDDVGWIDAADPILGVLGGTLVGATVDCSPDEPVESRVLLLPAGWSERFETGPSCSVLAYGGPPEDPAVRHFEEELWSENPIEPPEAVDPDDPALADEEGHFTHADLVETAQKIVAEHGLDEESTVLFDASLSEPGALVAGILAPVVAGACVHLPVAGSDVDAGEEVDLLVTADETTADSGVVQVADLTRSMRDTRRA